jgi:hypothetical protein
MKKLKRFIGFPPDIVARARMRTRCLLKLTARIEFTRPPMASRLPLKWIGGSARPLAARLTSYQLGIDPVGSKGCNCVVSTVRCDARKRPASRVKRMLTSRARNDVIDPKRSSTRGADLNLLTALKLCKLGPPDNHDNEANEYAD